MQGNQARSGEHIPNTRNFTPGKFGRMFPELPLFQPTEESLRELADAMLDTGDKKGDNVFIPAGYTYLGQFIDHDISFDTTPIQKQVEDPLALRNFRTPSFELDSVYGLGPQAAPFLYQRRSKPDEALFLVGKTTDGLAHDVPRTTDQVAIVADPRNDENLLVAQMHTAFLKFHNKVLATSVEDTTAGLSRFEIARRSVIWHYQWIILHDFLPKLVDRDILEEVDGAVRQNGAAGLKLFKWEKEPFIPLEFSLAAYRLGHSMVREKYKLNEAREATLSELFTFTGNGGNAPFDQSWIVNWRRFFLVDAEVPVNASRKIDTKVSETLHNIPEGGTEFSLPFRNLLRGAKYGLPCGQEVARAMNEVVLTEDQILSGTDKDILARHGFQRQTPLWYYLMKEAELTQKGRRLGRVGGRIVAEVFYGLLLGDRGSFLSVNAKWRPSLGAGSDFTMTDLLLTVDDFFPQDPAPTA